MASIVDETLCVYCFVDDWLKTHRAVSEWRRSPNAHPLFSDAEVITIGLLQGCLGVATLKEAYRFARQSLGREFPHLPSYAQWLSRLHALSGLTGQLVQAAIGKQRLPERLYLMDAKPIPVAKPIRHGRVRLLREDGASFGKGSTGWFFGFKLHVLTHVSGAVLSAVLTPANMREQDVAMALSETVQGGVCLADLGYRGEPLKESLAEETQMLLITPADAGDDLNRRALISSVRERVETTFSALWSRFIDRVLSRSWEGLWSSIKLKLLHLNLCTAGTIPR